MDQVWTSLSVDDKTSDPSSSSSSSASSDSDKYDCESEELNYKTPLSQVFQDARMSEDEETAGNAQSIQPTLQVVDMDRPLPASRSIDTSSALSVFLYKLRQCSRFWKGLAPALLLCSNPAINYTVYDVLKSRVLGVNAKQLTMPQAFALGLVAKFAATMITYPLIRAKVILMVSKDDDVANSNNSPTLYQCLQQSYHCKTLYKGCDWQLLHTLLKSALMMMVRERITERTKRFVVGAGGEMTTKKS
ncbi:MAG: hypothetical protein SGILL_000599 [Bacillariaceae sp.]